MKKIALLILSFALVIACGAPSSPPPQRVVHGGVFGGGGGGGGSPPPTGTGFITVTNGVQDGTALVYPLAESKGGTGATSFPGPKGTSLVFSLADYGQGRADTWINADYTVGIKFTPIVSTVAVKGVRFWYDEPAHSARAIKVTLVNLTGSSLVEAVTTGSLAAGAIYEVDFASTHALTAFSNYAVTVRTTTGIFAAFDSGSGLGPAIMNGSFPPGLFPWRVDGRVSLPLSCVLYVNGDNPTGVAANAEAINGRIVPIEPVFSQ